MPHQLNYWGARAPAAPLSLRLWCWDKEVRYRGVAMAGPSLWNYLPPASGVGFPWGSHLHLLMLKGLFPSQAFHTDSTSEWLALKGALQTSTYNKI